MTDLWYNTIVVYGNPIGGMQPKGITYRIRHNKGKRPIWIIKIFKLSEYRYLQNRNAN